MKRVFFPAVVEHIFLTADISQTEVCPEGGQGWHQLWLKLQFKTFLRHLS